MRQSTFLINTDYLEYRKDSEKFKTTSAWGSFAINVIEFILFGSSALPLRGS